MDSFNEYEIAYFWTCATKENKCWIWKGKFFESGYPRFNFHGKSFKGHRLAYQFTKGEIPKGMCVCHACDTPSCVNPEHLWLGSSKENTQDMIVKGRIVRLRSKHKDSACKYPGITFRKGKKSKPWRARIMRNYQTIWQGEFETQELAHIARNKAFKHSISSGSHLVGEKFC